MKTYTYKLYPNKAQEKCLERWLGICCWVFNRALEHRIKAYKRRKEFVDYYKQQALLTEWRFKIERIQTVPALFSRDALRRVDVGFKEFFKRVKNNQTPGFPRFKSKNRYNSMEYLKTGFYLNGDKIRVPNLGKVRCRGKPLPEGTQKGLRIVQKASGWYAQILLVNKQPIPEKKPSNKSIGIDVGLQHFLSTSDGEHVENPRFYQKSEKKLKSLQRRVSRRKKGSNRRKKALKSLKRQHEKIADQRKYFCHQVSTDLIKKYDLIAVEKLDVKSMVKSRFAKGIGDAAWRTFTNQLIYKAEDAGKSVVFVNPRYTSQECPDCGAIKKKQISERIHSCECGLNLQRDVASAKVILKRALVVAGANCTWTDSTAETEPCSASS